MSSRTKVRDLYTVRDTKFQMGRNRKRVGFDGIVIIVIKDSSSPAGWLVRNDNR